MKINQQTDIMFARVVLHTYGKPQSGWLHYDYTTVTGGYKPNQTSHILTNIVHIVLYHVCIIVFSKLQAQGLCCRHI